MTLAKHARVLNTSHDKHRADTARLGALLRLLALAWLLGGLQTGCTDGCGAPGSDIPPVELLYPNLNHAENVDWGEVNLMTFVTKEVVLLNDGDNTLSISNVLLAVGDSVGANQNRFTITTDLSELSTKPLSLGVGKDLRIRIKFEGYVEGVANDTLVVESNDPDQPRLELPLQAAVVRPILNLFPTKLVFDDVFTGAASTKTLDIKNSGKGTLAIYELNFKGDVDGEFSYTLPSSFQLGQTLSGGTGIEVGITYSPKNDGADNVTLEVVSSDPKQPRQNVTLSANGQVDDPPQVVILSPYEGDTYYVGSSINLRGKVVDDGLDLSKMTILWLSSTDGQLCPNLKPDAEGNFQCQATFTKAGDQTITLTALDSSNQQAIPVSVKIVIWDLETPLSYVISGSSETSLYAYTPDDNIQIFVVDGQNPLISEVCVNAIDDRREAEPPRTCQAKYGDIIQIKVYDRYGSGFGIPALHLWYGREDEYDQPLIEEPISRNSTAADYETFDLGNCLPTPTREEWYATHGEDEPPPDCLVYVKEVVVEIPPPEPQGLEVRHTR